MKDPDLALSRFVARRYLRSTRKDAYITFLSLSAIGGICLGVAALILALAALNGFQTALREETLARTPHLELEIDSREDREAIVAVLEEVIRSGRDAGVDSWACLVGGKGQSQKRPDGRL